jgi:hypothetical protein
LDSTNESFKGAATEGDRRRHKRHAFSATAEVVDMVSGARLSSRAADLNQGSCYLDSLNPLPIGSNLCVRIRWCGAELTCTAVVRNSQPGMGMGVGFTETHGRLSSKVGSKGCVPLRLRISRRPLFRKMPNLPPPPYQSDALAVQLIDLLHKKGLLSSNDVASLLRDRILWTQSASPRISQPSPDKR